MKKSHYLILVAACLFMFFTISSSMAAVIYTVKSGDTIFSIAKKYGVTMESILESNSELESEKSLKVGMALLVPESSEDVVPVDYGKNQTQTLIVHGTPKQQNKTSSEQAVNVMTVNGRTVTVPTHRSAEEKAKYRGKYSNMSSRGFMGGNTIVKTAFNFIGVPYVFGGSTPSGFDCSGFVQYVYRMCGVKIPRMAHHQYYAGTPIGRKSVRPGDLVFFETYTQGISHVGIYIGDNKFIHASSKGAVRIDSLGAAYYTSAYRGAARY